MIASVSGILETKGDDYVIVNVNGLGLKAFVTTQLANEIGRIGDEVYLRTSLILRQDSVTLFGFANELEHFTYEALLGASGVGPKLALAVLNTLSPEMIASAIHKEDADLLATVPGIGKKTAAKISLDLKGKLMPSLGVEDAGVMISLETDLLEMLTSLGFSIAESQAAIQSIPKDAPDDIEERLRLALMYFDQ